MKGGQADVVYVFPDLSSAGLENWTGKRERHKRSMTKITCFDGVNCIGGNSILLEDGDSRLFLDFGTNYSKLGSLYDEFMKPKSCTGLYESLVMGIIPPIHNLYRRDLVATLADPWEVLDRMGMEVREIDEIGGVLVSHGHVDHIGDIHHMRRDIPIHASTMTAAICRALQDTAGSSSVGDYFYYTNKVEIASGGLSSQRGVPRIGRRYRITDNAPDDFRAFWNADLPKQKLEAVDFEQASECAGLKAVTFPVDHSLYGACGWAVAPRQGRSMHGRMEQSTDSDDQQCVMEAASEHLLSEMP